MRKLLFAALLPAQAALAQTPLTIELETVATGLGGIVDISHAGDDRLFLTLQPGVIRILDGSGNLLPTPFLDIQDLVNDGGNEQGLLGLAFDPNYQENGFFYVHYTFGSGNGNTRIERYSVSADPNVADPESDHLVYAWPQPASNHNGGDLDFGPDGYLYIPLGDGGGAGDTQNNAQDLSDPLGDIVRIDVSDPDTAYTLPPTNPFVNATGGDTLPEIWASGLRNPFRLSFDRENGDLWLGDVGQSAWEEIDHVPAGTPGGTNFGWRCYEGTAPFNTTDCGPDDAYYEPATVHINDGNFSDWCAIIGGFVYRGEAWPNLGGHYIYTDFCKPQIWALKEAEAGTYMDHMVFEDTAMTGWTTMGDNAAGELFLGNGEPGEVYKLIDKCPMAAPVLTLIDGMLMATEGADSTYNWYVDGQSIPGVHTTTYIPTQTGMYAVVAVYLNGCEVSSEPVQVNITGIADHLLPTLVMAPNPALDQVVLEWDRTNAVELVRFVDPQGRTAYEHRSPKSTRHVVDVRGLASGQYAVQLLSRDGMVLTTQRLVVAR